MFSYRSHFSKYLRHTHHRQMVPKRPHTGYLTCTYRRTMLLSPIGSALIGSVLGMLLAVAHVKMTAAESLLLLFGLMLGVSLTAKDLGLNHLIICLFMGVVFVVTNLVVDILYAYIDPRIRLT